MALPVVRYPDAIQGNANSLCRQVKLGSCFPGQNLKRKKYLDNKIKLVYVSFQQVKLSLSCKRGYDHGKRISNKDGFQ